ncbi:MAG TPA: SMP-30/gluconolactonase/LRE family protein [Spirochaetes bacterium]|nr:SMP-30/gluconolactonase/LRE family protein [Spirochaetota bacterium]
MIFAKGFSGPEGPVVLDDGSILIVEFASDKGCVTHISSDGKTSNIIAKTGSPNGLAVDKNGVIWVAESKEPSLLKMTMDGKYEIFLTGCNGESFMLPNDLAFGPDGALYLTDSGFRPEDFYVDGKARDDYQNIPYDGRVYRINTETKDIVKLDSGILLTNGIAFGPDDDLYVNETNTGMVYRYRVEKDKSGVLSVIGKREDFGNVLAPGDYGRHGPDGMKFGADGNLYVAVWGQGDVTVLGQDGNVVKRIKTGGMQPTNLAFGLAREKKLYVTEMEFGTVEVYDIAIEGLPLHK